MEAALAELTEQPLRAGARLRLCLLESPPYGLVFSFAGIYLLLVAFEAPFNRFQVEPQLRRALPVLTQLVSRLPPLDGGEKEWARGRRLSLKPPSK